MIAAVNGHCLGYGLTLVTWCDFVIASEHARRSAFPRCAIGVPTIVGAIRLPRADRLAARRWSCCSPATASTPQRAKEIGLVGWVVPHDELMAEARRLADRLAARRAARRAGDQGGRVRAQHLPTLEAIRFGETMRKVAAAAEAEGARAARERRDPQWKGR